MSWMRRVLGRDRRAVGPGLPAGAEALLSDQAEWWALLDEAERARLLGIAEHLLARKRWEAARGFELTDEVRVLVAAHAARLVLGLDDTDDTGTTNVAGRTETTGVGGPIDAAIEVYDDVGSIIVHRSTVRQRHDARWSPRSGGIVQGGPLNLDGQAHQRGPVLISWGAARREIRRPGRGYNVIYHEFAHKLDMLTLLIDGTPMIADDTARRRWVEVCTAEFERVQRGDEGPLRAYAGTNPAEFFAVATEVFFDRPVALADERPELYDVLRAYFRQDPAARQRQHDAEAASATGGDGIRVARGGSPVTGVSSSDLAARRVDEGATSPSTMSQPTSTASCDQPALTDSAPTTCDSATGR